MAGSVFTFLYNTIKDSVNDRGSKIWLPPVLERLGLPLVRKEKSSSALTEDSFKGADSIQQIIAGQWFQLVGADLKRQGKQELLSGFLPIADPDAPNPVFSLCDLTVHGLQNTSLLPLEVLASGAQGYSLTISASNPAYEDVEKLYATGSFEIRQSVCGAETSSPTACTGKELPVAVMKWPKQMMSWSGSFRIDLVKATCLDVKLHIGVRGQERMPAVEVESAAVRGGAAAPEIVLDGESLQIQSEYPAIDWIFKQQTINAFSYPETQASIINAINRALQSEDVLKKIASALEQYFCSALDEQLGRVSGVLPVAGQPMPNPVDQYLFDRVRYALSSDGSPFYLPALIRNSQNPCLEPYCEREILLGSYPVLILRLSHIRLRNFLLSGLSNSRPYPDSLLFENGHIKAAVPVTLRAQGQLFFLLDGLPFNGGLEVRINQARLQLDLLFGGGDLSNLTVELVQIALENDPDRLSVYVALETRFLSLINQYFNHRQTKSGLIQKLNAAADRQKHDLSHSITEKLRAMIAERLKK